MARQAPPSEFGGHQQRNTIAPPVTPWGTPGHEPTANDLLRLTYLTGQTDDSTMDPIDGVMEGLLPLAEALEKMPNPAKFFG
jgi:hypothetical protein